MSPQPPTWLNFEIFNKKNNQIRKNLNPASGRPLHRNHIPSMFTVASLQNVPFSPSAQSSPHSIVSVFLEFSELLESVMSGWLASEKSRSKLACHSVMWEEAAQWQRIHSQVQQVNQEVCRKLPCSNIVSIFLSLWNLLNYVIDFLCNCTWHKENLDSDTILFHVCKTFCVQSCAFKSWDFWPRMLNTEGKAAFPGVSVTRSPRPPL